MTSAMSSEHMAYAYLFSEKLGELALAIAELPPDTPPGVPSSIVLSKLKDSQIDWEKLEGVLNEVWGSPGAVRIEDNNVGSEGFMLIHQAFVSVKPIALARLPSKERLSALDWIFIVVSAVKNMKANVERFR